MLKIFWFFVLLMTLCVAQRKQFTVSKTAHQAVTTTHTTVVPVSRAQETVTIIPIGGKQETVAVAPVIPTSNKKLVIQQASPSPNSQASLEPNPARIFIPLPSANTDPTPTPTPTTGASPTLTPLSTPNPSLPVDTVLEQILDAAIEAGDCSKTANAISEDQLDELLEFKNDESELSMLITQLVTALKEVFIAKGATIDVLVVEQTQSALTQQILEADETVVDQVLEDGLNNFILDGCAMIISDFNPSGIANRSSLDQRDTMGFDPTSSPVPSSADQGNTKGFNPLLSPGLSNISEDVPGNDPTISPIPSPSNVGDNILGFDPTSGIATSPKTEEGDKGDVPGFNPTLDNTNIPQTEEAEEDNVPGFNPTSSAISSPSDVGNSNPGFDPTLSNAAAPQKKEADEGNVPGFNPTPSNATTPQPEEPTEDNISGFDPTPGNMTIAQMEEADEDSIPGFDPTTGTSSFSNDIQENTIIPIDLTPFIPLVEEE